MLDIAKRGEFVLIGPNCSGFHAKRYKGKFTGPVPDLKGERIDVIIGSGATVDFIMDQATMRGVSFGDVVNLGNSIMVGVEDFLGFYDENYGPDSAKILMIYMESVRKPQKLLKHARSLVEKGCHIVGVKSGATEAGQRAAESHTGAMAGSDTAVQALFDKAGIIRVKSKMELIDVTCALVCGHGPIKGNRVCVLTDAGGPGVMLSDELCRQGLILPPLKETTRKRLSEILPKEAATGNPIDCLPSRTAESIEATIRVLGEEEEDSIDAIVFIVGDSGISDVEPIYKATWRAMDESPIPVVPVWVSLSASAEKIDRFRKTEKVFFPEEVRAAESLGKIARRPILSDPVDALPGYDKAAMTRLMEGKKGVLDPDTAENLLKAAGFTLPAQAEVLDKAALSESCDKIGYPLVMKVIGPLHKSDVGGVKIGIGNLSEAETAFSELMAIQDATGALLQPMVSGTEMILGASREGDYGHLIMFGLGGIYTEVLKDVCFALAPLSPEESMDLIRGIRTLPILEGIRGQKGVDLEMVSDNLQRLGRLVTDFPRIREIDLNPLKGVEKDLYAIDARIILDD
jgi:acetyltransferase